MSFLTPESASTGVFQGNGDVDGGTQSLSNETGICKYEESQAQNVACVADANKTLVTNKHSPIQQTHHMETPSIDNHTTPTSLPTHANLSFTPTNTISEAKLTTNSSLATHDVIEFWDPLSPVNFRYINPRDGHMMASILPPDLKFVETSELLPMAYDDFTKCLEEDLRRSPGEKYTSAEDDCVVPSVSPRLQAASGRCASSCSESSSDESHHYDLDSMEAKKLVKSRRSLSCNSPYGTLNWGLSPTIIYKTPDYERSVNVGNGCMKCSISEGNVELITPPQSSHSRLRRSRRRKLRRHERRKSLNFGDMIDEGVQEVPTNADQENGKNRDSDCISNDPMWFKEDSEWEVCFKDEDLRIHEEALMECFANLKNVLPKSQEAQSREEIISVAVDCIRNLQERITELGRRTGRNAADKEQELSEKLSDFQEAEDVFGVLPQFSWSDIDEPCYEIQAILDSLPLVPDTTIDDNVPSIVSPTIEPKTKKKRKYSKRASTKQKCTKKSKRKLTDDKQDTASENMNSSDRLTSEVPAVTSASSLDDSQGSWCLSPHNQSRPMTTIIHRSTPILSPSPNSTPYCPIATAIPLQTLGTPLILPKPPPITCFSPPATSGHVLSTTSWSPLLPSFVPVLPARVSFPGSSPSRSFQTSPLLPRVPLVHTGLSIPVPSPSFPSSPRLLPLTSSAMAQHPLAWYQTGKPLSVQEWWDSSDSEGRYGKSEKAAKKKTIPNGYMLFCKEKRNGLNTENPELKSRPGDITKLLSKKWKQLIDEERRPYEKEAMKMRCNENEWIMETP